MPFSRLLELIYQAVEALPGPSIENTVRTLESGATGDALRSSVLDSVALPHERLLITLLLDCWHSSQPSLPALALAAALRSAAYTRVKALEETQSEMVWTGPSHGISARRTDQALLQVIQMAEKELLLVTFAAYKVPLIVEALRRALERGVTVRFVAESAEESAGKVAFDASQVLGTVADRLQIYIWPKNRRPKNEVGKYGSLHAKCALADQQVLLVSSANLTDYALSVNVEMGLLIQGGLLPKEAYTLFSRLIKEQEFVII